MPQMSLEDLARIVEQVRMPGKSFHTFRKGDGFLIQLRYPEPDIYTGRVEMQHARKWYVSTWSTETEVVETCFKAARMSAEHQLREHFTYKGRRVYSPHFDIDARLSVCDGELFDRRPDARPKEE